LKRVAALVATFFLAACGGPTRRARPPSPPVVRDAGADASRDAAADAGPDALALLTERRDELAPGARQILATDADPSREPEIPLPKADVATCVRVAFDAEAPTKLTLVDASGRTLGAADGTSGAIGESGPVCFRAGGAPVLRLDGGSHVRVVVWATP